MPMAAEDTATAPAPPPNLRMSAQEDRECGNCVHYDNGHCKKFAPLCVDDEWVCDAWKAGGRDTEPGEAPASSAKTVRQAGKDALALARARARETKA
jgi:hypothetical protein